MRYRVLSHHSLYYAHIMRWYVEHSAQSSSLIHVNVYGRWCLVAAKNGKTHLNSSAVSTDEFRESVRICAHWFHTPSYLIQTACCKGDPNIYILHKPNPSFQSQKYSKHNTPDFENAEHISWQKHDWNFDTHK